MAVGCLHSSRAVYEQHPNGGGGCVCAPVRRANMWLAGCETLFASLLACGVLG